MRPTISRLAFLRLASVCAASAAAASAAACTAPLKAPAAASPGARPAELHPAADDLAQLLEPLRTAAGLPALAGAVTSGDRLLAVGATGVRKLGDPAAVTAEDRFHLGSCTKAMTAVLVAQEVEAGRLAWDAPLATLLPEAAATMDPAYRAVTLPLLLGHRAGVGDAGAHVDLWGELWRSQDPLPAQRRRLATETLARPPASTPGTSFAYSNFGYIIVGAVLERATGQPWETLMRERIFAPLGMTSCGFGAAGTPGRVDQPWGHRGDVPVEPGPGADNPPAAGPAGTVHCSMADWAKFVAIFLAGRREPFLAADSLARLITPLDGQEYGGGWIVVDRPWAGGRALTHGGSNTLNHALVWVAPGKDRAFLVAANRGDESVFPVLDGAIGALIEAYLGPP